MCLHLSRWQAPPDVTRACTLHLTELQRGAFFRPTGTQLHTRTKDLQPVCSQRRTLALANNVPFVTTLACSACQRALCDVTKERDSVFQKLQSGWPSETTPPLQIEAANKQTQIPLCTIHQVDVLHWPKYNIHVRIGLIAAAFQIFTLLSWL